MTSLLIYVPWVTLFCRGVVGFWRNPLGLDPHIFVMSRQVGVKRRAYDPSMVDHAADVVRNGSMSLSQASKVYKIPKTTLHDRINNKYTSTKIGVRTVLSPEEETRIEQWALHMSRIGYGRTRKELAHIVKQIIDEDGRKNPFVNNTPGRKWMDGFFGRHPALNLRTTVQLGRERAVINKVKILKWFEDLERYVTEEVGDAELLQDPSRVYNADESGISLCQTKNRKVVGEAGAPVVYQYGNSDKTQMTIMAAASAVGHYIQPMIIFPGQRFSFNPLDGFEEAAMGRSENGWMDAEVFTSWLTEVFIPGVEARHIKKPVLLLIDGHKTHITMKASNICVEHGIELYCLLEHSSHLTQPLDLRLFGILKQSWRKAVRNYQSENIGEFVTKQTFARVFKKAWLKSATIDAAIKGFQESGIFPWNPQRVLASVKLVPSTIFTDAPAATETDSSPSSSSKPDMIASVAAPALAPSASPATSIAMGADVQASAIGTSESAPAMAAGESPVTSIAEEISASTLVDVAPESSPNALQSVHCSTEPVTTPAIPRAECLPSASGDAPSPFSKYLVFPKTETKKPKAKRMIIPKAITGVKYRDWLKEKEAKKEAELKERQQRQAEGLQKKHKRDEELKEKKLKLEKKCKEREEEKKKRRELKEKKKQDSERILKEIEASDSDDNVNVSVTDCYKCETPYDEYIQCTNCFRRFHLSCVSDEIIDCPGELLFECKYC